MDFVIGVDGGATKTAAVILDREGHVLGRGQSAAANPFVVGWEGAREAILAAVTAAARDAGVQVDRAQAMTWALGGVERPAERQKALALAQTMVPGVPVRVENDALAALVGGLGVPRGMVLIAGTGMIAYGRGEDGTSARAGGWGYALDVGSAHALALAGLRAVLRDGEGSDLPTRLRTLLLRALDLEQPNQVIPWLYAADRSHAEVAALAPWVVRAAAEGDTVAADLVAEAADVLAALVASVARRLFPGEEDVPLVLSGGLLLGEPFYRDAVAQSIRTQVPRARLFLPYADAAVGAARLAWEMVGQTLEPYPAPSLDREEGPWASESRNVFTRELDRRSDEQVVGLMHVEDRRAVRAVRAVLPDIARAVDAIAARMAQGGRLIYVGAGTSGRLGVLDASECPPTFGVDPHVVVGVIAGGDVALRRAVEGAEDVAEDGARAVADLNVGPLDTVVGITASGRTPYVLGALEEARRRGALTVGVICNLPAPVADLAEITIAPLVGPEVITGSTRLKAGTAQKLVLNMLSTATMIRLGKVYDNLMVDVQQDNEKLRARARRIVMEATGVDVETAASALQQSGGDVKVAIVSLLTQRPPGEARERLLRSGGRIREAIHS